MEPFPASGQTESNTLQVGGPISGDGRGGTMIAELFDSLFGCKHSDYTFPISVRPSSHRNAAAKLTGTYVACLDCGKEFPYDWQEMKVIDSPAEQRNYTASVAHKAAA
jgi:hypothetical protein